MFGNLRWLLALHLLEDLYQVGDILIKGEFAQQFDCLSVSHVLSEAILAGGVGPGLHRQHPSENPGPAGKTSCIQDAPPRMKVIHSGLSEEMP